jgi:predicted Mrr-cat superfamily restriction endonuclease
MSVAASCSCDDRGLGHSRRRAPLIVSGHGSGRAGARGVRDLQLIGDDRAAIKAELTRSYPQEKPGTIAAWAGVLLRFGFEPAVGDLIAHPERATSSVSLGRIESDYYWEAPDRHCRRVRWLARRVPRSDFSDEARQELSARVAFFAVRAAAGDIARLATRT